MPGWIIQGVRGEGKSLCAVDMIRRYMLQGRVVASNLDLYLEHLLPDYNATLAYRLPDHPRLQDFELLPPAYDVKYKAEDKNGLLVLDELGTWLNSRSWNDKERLKMLNWLFLSRKNHWDLVLLAQDHEMIDAQVRTTLCDYLVQASRTDRLKIPYLGNILEFFGFSAYMPKYHRYHVYYGLSTQQKPVETWTVHGHDVYDGYDTNQRFRDGYEALGGTLVDMRATYTYLPANYLTRHVFIERLHSQIRQLQNNQQKQHDMTAKKQINSIAEYSKPVMLLILLTIFVIWKYSAGAFDFTKKDQDISDSIQQSIKPVTRTQPAQEKSSVISSVNPENVEDVYKASFSTDALLHLLKLYRPRLSMIYSTSLGLSGSIDFYDETVLAETYSFKELHALGATIIKKPYGVELLYSSHSFVITSWHLPRIQDKSVDSQIALTDAPSD